MKRRQTLSQVALLCSIVGGGSLESAHAQAPAQLELPPWSAWTDLPSGACLTPGLLMARRDPQRRAALSTWSAGDTSPAPSVGSVYSTLYPLRVHYRLEDQLAQAQDLLGMAEIAWEAEVNGLGFDPPEPDGESGGDDALDLYLASYDYTGGQAVTLISGFDVRSGDGRQSCTSSILIYEGLPVETLPVTVAHELNHALQAAMDFQEHPWIWEATATAVEDIVFDEINDYTRMVAQFQQFPEQTLMLFEKQSIYGLYPYGGSIFIRFLMERYFSADPYFLRNLWKYMQQDDEQNEPDFLDAVSRQLTEGGASWNDALLEFSAWRVFTGSRAISGSQEEAELWEGSEVPYYFELTSDQLPARGILPGLYELGVQYLAISSAGAPFPTQIHVQVQGDAEHSYGVTGSLLDQVHGSVVLERAALSNHQSTLNLPAGSTGTLVVGVVDLGRSDFDAELKAEQAPVTVELEAGGCGCTQQGAPPLPWASVVFGSVLGLQRWSRRPKYSLKNTILYHFIAS